jgi:hypothetical protein
MLFEKMRKELLQAAGEGRTVTYGHLMSKFELLRGGSGEASVVGALGEIDKDEHRKGAPGFAAIVVRKDTGFPGGGFFCWDDLPSNVKRPKDRGQNPTLSEAEKRYVRTQQEKIWTYYESNRTIEAYAEK